MTIMAKLDSLDERIIKQLSDDAQQTSKELSQQLNVSPSTIRRRIRTLIRNGIARTVMLVDPRKIGFPLIAVIALDIENVKANQAVKKLVDYEKVKWVATATGRFDILVIGVFHSTDELSDFVQTDLASIEGLRNSETFICLQVKKGSYVRL